MVRPGHLFLLVLVTFALIGILPVRSSGELGRVSFIDPCYVACSHSHLPTYTTMHNRPYYFLSILLPNATLHPSPVRPPPIL